jgi:Cu/Zn superoxide dismutase
MANRNRVKEMRDKCFGLAASITSLVVVSAIAFAQDVQKRDDISTRLADGIGLVLTENSVGRVIVDAVIGSGPAATAGIKKDDILIAIDDETITSREMLSSYLQKRRVVEGVFLKVARGNEVLSIPVVPVQEPPGAKRGPSTKVSALPSDEAGVFGMYLIEDDKGRIVVTKVGPETPADHAGMAEGDIIVSVGDYLPTSLKELSVHINSLVARKAEGEELALSRLRGDQTETVRLVISGGPGGHGAVGTRAESRIAVARLAPVGPESEGRVAFLTLEDRGKAVDVQIDGEGFEPGTYRLTVHEFGDCGDLANGSAGGPLRATGEPGSGLSPGDMALVKVSDDGQLHNRSLAEGLALAGPNSVVGRAVILQPTFGEMYQPVAAGVIGIGNPRRHSLPAGRRSTDKVAPQQAPSAPPADEGTFQPPAAKPQ